MNKSKAIKIPAEYLKNARIFLLKRTAIYKELLCSMKINTNRDAVATMNSNIRYRGRMK